MKNVTLFLLLLMVAGCSSNSTSTVQGTDIASAYPAEYAYPGTDQIIPTPKIVPTQTTNPEYGIVTGTILLAGNPVAGKILYLAELIVSTDGQEIAAGLNPASSPMAITDENGYFKFVNVQPGRYGMIIDTGISSSLVMMPNSPNEAIKIQVESKSKIDMGTMDYTELPDM
jgi:protocatechuate 3,4-dioxygenase beta subunit